MLSGVERIATPAESKHPYPRDNNLGRGILAQSGDRRENLTPRVPKIPKPKPFLNS